jgi:hypothetical protein
MVWTLFLVVVILSTAFQEARTLTHVYDGVFGLISIKVIHPTPSKITTLDFYQLKDQPFARDANFPFLPIHELSDRQSRPLYVENSIVRANLSCSSLSDYFDYNHCKYCLKSVYLKNILVRTIPKQAVYSQLNHLPSAKVFFTLSLVPSQTVNDVSRPLQLRNNFINVGSVCVFGDLEPFSVVSLHLDRPNLHIYYFIVADDMTHRTLPWEELEQQVEDLESIFERVQLIYLDD